MMGRESPEQWPSMSLLSQLLVISTSPPHTQVALARPVQAAHSKRLERMAREKGFHSRCPKRCQRERGSKKRDAGLEKISFNQKHKTGMHSCRARGRVDEQV